MTWLQSEYPKLTLVVLFLFAVVVAAGIGTVAYFFVWWPLRNLALRAWHEHLIRAHRHQMLDEDPNHTEVIPIRQHRRYRHRDGR